MYSTYMHSYDSELYSTAGNMHSYLTAILYTNRKPTARINSTHTHIFICLSFFITICYFGKFWRRQILYFGCGYNFSWQNLFLCTQVIFRYLQNIVWLILLCEQWFLYKIGLNKLILLIFWEYTYIYILNILCKIKYIIS